MDDVEEVEEEVDEDEVEVSEEALSEEALSVDDEEAPVVSPGGGGGGPGLGPGGGGGGPGLGPGGGGLAFEEGALVGWAEGVGAGDLLEPQEARGNMGAVPRKPCRCTILPT